MSIAFPVVDVGNASSGGAFPFRFLPGASAPDLPEVSKKAFPDIEGYFNRFFWAGQEKTIFSQRFGKSLPFQSFPAESAPFRRLSPERPAPAKKFVHFAWKYSIIDVVLYSPASPGSPGRASPTAGLNCKGSEGPLL